ncbi:MAG: hypothetical protein K6A82_02995 [Prevotella sp.]|nr:hypothetical protein [Prevotella sp.]
MTDGYDDIIRLPHHVSRHHPQMSLYSRAAQFAPFAALTGYEAAISETARSTRPKVELMEDGYELLDRKFALLRQHLEEHPLVSLTCFQADKHKPGGDYLALSGIVRDIRIDRRVMVMENGKLIPLDSIVELDGDVFSLLEMGEEQEKHFDEAED